MSLLASSKGKNESLHSGFGNIKDTHWIATFLIMIIKIIGTSVSQTLVTERLIGTIWKNMSLEDNVTISVKVLVVLNLHPTMSFL